VLRRAFAKGKLDVSRKKENVLPFSSVPIINPLPLTCGYGDCPNTASWHLIAVNYLPHDPKYVDPLRMEVGLGSQSKPMVSCDDHQLACEHAWNHAKMLTNVKRLIRSQTGIAPDIDPTRTTFEWKEIPNDDGSKN
jgi:hypothetical protein